MAVDSAPSLTQDRNPNQPVPDAPRFGTALSRAPRCAAFFARCEHFGLKQVGHHEGHRVWNKAAEIIMCRRSDRKAA
jgi:hypothetical protein